MGLKCSGKEIYSNEDLDLRSFYYAPPPLLLLLSPLSPFLLVAELRATVCAIAAALVSPLTSALPRPEAGKVGGIEEGEADDKRGGSGWSRTVCEQQSLKS
jgi:hypothetical protein